LDATVVVLDAGIVEFEAGVVVLDAGAAPWVVPAERSITPTLGTTSDPELAAAAEPLDPASEAQAARPNDRRLHNTTLRMCARAAKAGFIIDHYPGCVKQAPGQRSGERYDLEAACRDPDNDTHCWVAGNPAISGLLQLETGGFASPPCGGFALALWPVDLIEKPAAIVWGCRHSNAATLKKELVLSLVVRSAADDRTVGGCTAPGWRNRWAEGGAG
jgi:hypothetical protein